MVLQTGPFWVMTTATGEELLNWLCPEPQHTMSVSTACHKYLKYNEENTCVSSVIFSIMLVYLSFFCGYGSIWIRYDGLKKGRHWEYFYFLCFALRGPIKLFRSKLVLHVTHIQIHISYPHLALPKILNLSCLFCVSTTFLMVVGYLCLYSKKFKLK